MPPLANAQNDFIRTINDGPDALNPSQFAGPIDRIFLGLKAHANTISHARLTALEHTFPRTRAALGDASFNQTSRDYCETAAAHACDSNLLGMAFVEYLAGKIDDISILDLARIEWAWLESYHAADAQPLLLSALHMLDQAAMLALPIAAHPSAQIIKLGAPLHSALSEIGHDDTASTLLICRPEAEVKLLLVNDLTAAIFNAAKNNAAMSNLLSLAIELSDESAPLDPILKLIGAGALVTTGLAR
jgi:hypothetical protein